MAAASSSSSSSTPEWPGGFVFDPLDEVLVIHYLHPKATEISNCKCPEVIPECDLYGTEEPWQIWEKMEEANNCIRNKEEMFFFTRLKRVSSKSNRCKRSIGKDCWKGDGNSSNIFYCAYQNERKRIGIKKTYHYEKNNVKNDKSKSNDDDNNNNRYRWILHEISLDESLLHHAKTGDLVICRLRRHSKKEEIAPYMSASSQSITMIDHTTNLSNQVIGVPDYTLDQTTNMSNQILNIPNQIGEYWLDFLMTNSGEITINGIHKT
ncbi:NAC domain-containing protein 41-like [Quercus robur]|uniref:NAC domain-containing protein 41-like n=1 Tax=Quercus robur TaxID=38942 RepID=UPI002161C028|nr:NAC domain-containing protein 41-like [Quercus robur]